jgi:hypothetical protein
MPIGRVTKLAFQIGSNVDWDYPITIVQGGRYGYNTVALGEERV